MRMCAHGERGPVEAESHYAMGQWPDPSDMVSNIATAGETLNRVDCAAELLLAHSENRATMPLPMRLNAKEATHTWTSNKDMHYSKAETVRLFLHNAVVRIANGQAGHKLKALQADAAKQHAETGFSHSVVASILSTPVGNYNALTAFLYATKANRKKSKGQRSRAKAPAPKSKARKSKTVVKASASAPDYNAIFAAAKEQDVKVGFGADGSVYML